VIVIRSGSDEVPIRIDILKTQVLQGDLEDLSLLLHHRDHFVESQEPSGFKVIPIAIALLFLDYRLGFQGALLDQDPRSLR